MTETYLQFLYCHVGRTFDMNELYLNQSYLYFDEQTQFKTGLYKMQQIFLKLQCFISIKIP